MTAHRGWHTRYENNFIRKIWAQLQKVKNLDPKNEKTRPRKVSRTFNIDGTDRIIEVRRCRPNGRCLFEALWFQTEAKHYEYDKTAVKNFKQTILDTIERNFEIYKPFLDNHMAENNAKYIYMSEDEQKLLRDQLMADLRSGAEWGSSETIAAVQNLHNVNCLIFYDQSEAFNNFDMPYFDRRIFDDENSGMVLVILRGEHYDTVWNINDDNIVSISEKLASKDYWRKRRAGA